MTEPGMQLRQGDILAVALDHLPTDLEPLPLRNGDTIPLMPGETGTSGSHCLTATPAIQLFRKAGTAAAPEWLQIQGTTLRVTHPQHGDLTLEPGVWRIVRQRAFDPHSQSRPQSRPHID